MTVRTDASARDTSHPMQLFSASMPDEVQPSQTGGDGGDSIGACQLLTLVHGWT